MRWRLLATGIVCFSGMFTGAGQDFPTLGEIYDYQPGDVFETAHYFCCNEVFFQVERRTIEEKIVFENKNGYLTTLSRFNLLWEEPHKVVDTSFWQQPDTLWIPDPDSVIFSPGDSVVQDPALYHGRPIYIRKYYLLNALCEERYVRGCGLVYKGWGTPPSTSTSPQDSLTWYCTMEECWGSSLLVLRIFQPTHEFLVHPNPVAEVLTISKSNPMTIQSIRLMDLNGRITHLLDNYQTLNHQRIKLPVANLGSGIYVLSIETDRGSFVHKIVKL
jgi:hypothetical protein